MANQEQVAILKSGVDAWNAWRAENEGVRVDLSEADLTGADLTGADLTGADLTRAHLTEANLQGADLNGANLAGADLTGANLAEAVVSPVQLCTARTLAQVILDSSAVVDDVCNRCPDLFGPASAYEDGDPRRCGVY